LKGVEIPPESFLFDLPLASDLNKNILKTLCVSSLIESDEKLLSKSIKYVTTVLSGFDIQNCGDILEPFSTLN